MAVTTAPNATHASRGGHYGPAGALRGRVDQRSADVRSTTWSLLATVVLIPSDRDHWATVRIDVAARSGYQLIPSSTG